MQISIDRDDNPCLQQQQQQQQLSLRSLQLGLKDLTLVPYHPQSPLSSHKNSPSTMLSDLLSETSSPGLMSGDYIGMESCVDVLRDDDQSHSDYKRQNCYNQKVQDKREEKRLAKMKRMELPPPIPMLARTENLPSHMPWVLKRHYTSDGRLILTEEKVRHHEYFRAHRSNGRLTLQLVHLDDEVLAPPFVENQKNNVDNVDNVDESVYADDIRDLDDDHDEEEEEENDDDYCDDDDDDDNGDGEQEEEEEAEHDDEHHHDGVPEEPISTGKCFNFNSVGTGSPCIFGVPVPAIRQVHS